MGYCRFLRGGRRRSITSSSDSPSLAPAATKVTTHLHPIHKKDDPTVALCLGAYGDPGGVGVSYERGAPVEVSGTKVYAPYTGSGVQGYLVHKKPPPHRTIQEGYASGPMVVLGGGGFLCTRDPFRAVFTRQIGVDGQVEEREIDDTVEYARFIKSQHASHSQF